MWTAALVGLGGQAWAGPLDRPDPDDMGKHRCVERPVPQDTNAAPLGDRTVGSAPPGAPTYPAGVASSLVPYASDADLKKAAKKGVVVYPAVATLAVRGSTVIADCENRALDDNVFSWGCETRFACELYTRHDGAPLVLDRRAQAASKFSPVESVRDAVGLLAFYEPDLFLPLTPGELARWQKEAAGFLAVEPAIPWLEVEQQPGGWLIRAPRRVQCGCDRDIVRRAYWVSTDGRSCPLEEAPAVLAQATGACER